MDRAVNDVDEQARIRAMIESWADAARAKDVERLLAQHARDIVVFDCHSALAIRGLDAFRQHVEACLSQMSGPASMQVRDLEVTVGAEMAFCRYLVRCGGDLPTGQEHATWLRVTLCLSRRDGAWTVIHLHCSAPFDPESGRAMIELQPEDDAS